MTSLPAGVHLEDFTYTNRIIADQLFECVKNTQFKGVSGNVMFSDLGDRIARTQIEQMQGKGLASVLGIVKRFTRRPARLALFKHVVLRKSVHPCLPGGVPYILLHLFDVFWFSIASLKNHVLFLIFIENFKA